MDRFHDWVNLHLSWNCFYELIPHCLGRESDVLDHTVDRNYFISSSNWLKLGFSNEWPQSLERREALLIFISHGVHVRAVSVMYWFENENELISEWVHWSELTELNALIFRNQIKTTQIDQFSDLFGYKSQSHRSIGWGQTKDLENPIYCL